MLTAMAAGATVAATVSHLVDATEYVIQLQKLLKATETALDTADKLKTSGNRWFRVFKPVLTARAHYKEAVSVYAVAIEMITPCIDAMDPEEAEAFLKLAAALLDLRKTIYENKSYNRKLCIKFWEEAHLLRENAARSKDQVDLKRLKRKIPLHPRVEIQVPSPTTHSSATIPRDMLSCQAASPDPFLDPQAPPTITNSTVSGSSVQVSL